MKKKVSNVVQSLFNIRLDVMCRTSNRFCLEELNEKIEKLPITLQHFTSAFVYLRKIKLIVQIIPICLIIFFKMILKIINILIQCIWNTIILILYMRYFNSEQ